MPISDEYGNCGTNNDGSSSDTYCSFCYKDGGFTNPEQTLNEMIQSSIENMTGEIGMPLEQAEKLANDFIPGLGRWKEEN